MKKFRALLTILILALALSFSLQAFIGCKDKPDPNGDKPDLDINDISEEVTLDLAVFHNQSAAITYNRDHEYEAANGKTYRNGDIKPVWEELARRLNFKIVDKAVAHKDQNTLWEAVKNDNFQGFDMLTANALDINSEAVQNGTFVNIAEFLDQMPNLKAMLESHDIIQKSVFVGDKMFYAPYFDGFDDIERMIIVRADWVRALLDGEEEPDFDTDVIPTLGFNYTPFIESYNNVELTIVDPADSTKTKKITKNVSANQNIIKVQNELTTKNGQTLARALRDYIDATYPGLYGAERSNLFLSAGAAYDTDELIALLRVVKANPKLLTGKDVEIIPIYPRGNTNDRTHDLMRLAQIFGLRGAESRRDFLFVNKDGVLCDARQEAVTYDVIEILHTLYNDGLILHNFTDANAVASVSGTINLGSGFREKLAAQNRGFLTYDYNQTTTIYNTRIRNDLTEAQKEDFKNWDEFELRPILPPFTKWDNKEKVSRFTESWRSVKPNGWAIKAGISDAKLARCLKLMDYLYSPEGNRLMSYGPEEWIDGEIEYMGRMVPKLSNAALTELREYAQGNYTNYYRYYLGGTFPIGYIKEQGMEYQCTDEFGKIGQANINAAILLGTVDHLLTNSEDAKDDPTLMLMPTQFPLSKGEQAIITQQCTNLRESFDTTSSAAKVGNNWFSKLIMHGFGNGENQLGTKEEVLDKVSGTGEDKLNGITYLTIHREVFEYLYGITQPIDD